MCDDLETLRARCARLRAALAGVVFGDESCDSSEDEYARLKVHKSILDNALEVLRETAEEWKT